MKPDESISFWEVSGTYILRKYDTDKDASEERSQEENEIAHSTHQQKRNNCAELKAVLYHYFYYNLDT